jgi:hypothetical protein
MVFEIGENEKELKPEGRTTGSWEHKAQSIANTRLKSLDGGRSHLIMYSCVRDHDGPQRMGKNNKRRKKCERKKTFLYLFTIKSCTTWNFLVCAN